MMKEGHLASLLSYPYFLINPNNPNNSNDTIVCCSCLHCDNIIIESR